MRSNLPFDRDRIYIFDGRYPCRVISVSGPFAMIVELAQNGESLDAERKIVRERRISAVDQDFVKSYFSDPEPAKEQ